MNFEKLFHECGITLGPWECRHNWWIGKNGKCIATASECNAELISQSPELLKALIEVEVKKCVRCRHDVPCALCVENSYNVNLIEKSLSRPGHPMTWEWIKTLLEDEG